MISLASIALVLEGRAAGHQTHFVLQGARPQALLDLDAKPAVDAAVDEVEREQVDDQQRRDHQATEHQDGANRQAGAGRMIAIIAIQLPQLARQQHHQRDHAEDREQQYPGLPAREQR